MSEFQNTTMTGFTQPSRFLVPYYSLIVETLRVLQFATSALGVFTNCVNILVFWRVGVRESVTSLTFFVLSVSDLAYSLFLLGILSLQTYMSTISLRGLTTFHFAQGCFLYLTISGFSISSCITAVLAVQKCCCVIFPFTVKTIFTQRNVLFSIAFIAAVHFSLVFPIIAVSRFRPFTDPLTNTTLYAPPLDVGVRFMFRNIFRLLIQNILPTLVQVVVVVCFVVLLIKLRQASKFRKSATQSGEAKAKHPSVLSGKELRAVQSLTAVVAIFITCNTPVVLETYATFIEPDFDIQRYYTNIHSLVSLGIFAVQSVCSSVNIGVYVKYNSKFRKEVKILLWSTTKK